MGAPDDRLNREYMLNTSIRSSKETFMNILDVPLHLSKEFLSLIQSTIDHESIN